jgi:pimeloyl-ACP methyl ester carboxylesterase
VRQTRSLTVELSNERDGYLRRQWSQAVFRGLIAALVIFIISDPAIAQVQSYPPDFQSQEIATNGTTIHVRVGGRGPAVVLLHGYGETGDMWALGPTMAAVMRFAAANVEEKVIANSGHWLMEEQPEATVAAVRAFLDAKY